MADIFKEVDEDVRKERYLKLWRSYGRHAIAFAVAVMLTVAGVAGWREYQRSSLEAEGEGFAMADATAAAGRHAEAAVAFTELGADADGGYGALARLRQAAELIAAGDAGPAIAVYDAVAADTSVEPSLRDLASLLAAMHLMNVDVGGSGQAEIAARLEPLTAENGAWRYSARELDAVLKLKANDLAAALAGFAALMNDVGAPPALRARAAELFAALGGVAE